MPAINGNNITKYQDFATITQLNHIKIDKQGALTKQKPINVLFQEIGDHFKNMSFNGKAKIASRNEAIFAKLNALVTKEDVENQTPAQQREAISDKFQEVVKQSITRFKTATIDNIMSSKTVKGASEPTKLQLKTCLVYLAQGSLGIVSSVSSFKTRAMELAQSFAVERDNLDAIHAKAPLTENIPQVFGNRNFLSFAYKDDKNTKIEDYFSLSFFCKEISFIGDDHNIKGAAVYSRQNEEDGRNILAKLLGDNNLGLMPFISYAGSPKGLLEEEVDNILQNEGIHSLRLINEQGTKSTKTIGITADKDNVYVHLTVKLELNQVILLPNEPLNKSLSRKQEVAIIVAIPKGQQGAKGNTEKILLPQFSISELRVSNSSQIVDIDNPVIVNNNII